MGVDQERVGGGAYIRIPHSPVPRLEPPPATALYPGAKLVPLETRSDVRPYVDKQYDKPSSTKSVDRRRLKESGDSSSRSVATAAGGISHKEQESLEPFRGEGDTAALSMQAIIPTSVVKQPRWHRSMWTNYHNIGVNNPDEQSQKWEQHMSKFGRELANLQSALPPNQNPDSSYKLEDGYEISTEIISNYNLDNESGLIAAETQTHAVATN